MKSLRPSRGASKPAVGIVRSRYWIRSTSVEIRLEKGETLIGRGDDCHLRLSDSAVSREHAKLVMHGDDLFIEDLVSANGVYVNGVRIRRPTLLGTGDRIAIGHCELMVHSDALDLDVPTELTPSRPSESSDRLKRHVVNSGGERRSGSGVSHRAVTQPGAQSDRPRRSKPPALASARGSMRPSAPEATRWSAPRVSSQEPETLEYVGRMVDRMFAAGRMDTAKHLLSSHLQEVLNAARTSRRIDPRLADVAGRYAVRLASETLDSCWIDLCIELHIIAEKIMAEDTIEQLVELREKAPLGSRDLLRRYEHLLLGRVDRMPPADRALVARIACL